MISRTYFTETFYDMDVEIAQRFAQAIREAWVKGLDFEGEKKHGFFLSKNRGFDDKLYVGNIHRIENHLYWNDEELADDDEIVNVVVIDGPVTRDGDGCSYGSKDHRDQILYANTIPQVKGHIFIINTPGGAASARIDYEQAIADCREKGKPTVAWVDGMCASAGQLVASLCDRTIVMNGRDTMGCIGTMCAFWAVPHNTVDQDGYRYIELVSVTSPDKNAEYREAADGKTEKLQAELNRLGEEFRETVRQNRPLVKEEHLTGKTFDADEVMGALVDEVGDYARAIECVFELAGQTLTAARLVTAEPSEEPAEEPNDDPATKSQEAVSEAQDTETVVMETQFGMEAFVVEKKGNQKDNDMKEEEKKVDEVAERPATTQEAPSNTLEGGAQPATEQSAEGTAPANIPEEGEKVTTTLEETAAPSNSPEGEQGTEAPAVEEEEVSSNSPEVDEQGSEVPAAGTEEGTAASEEAIEGAQAEIDRITETLHNAEALVEQRDKEIASLKEQLATLEGIAEERDDANSQLSTLNSQLSERDASIEKLTKQVADLQAEVKELSEKPTPMTSSDAGVPASNATGEAPKVNQHQRIKRGMSYEEIRALRKQK